MSEARLPVTCVRYGKVRLQLTVNKELADRVDTMAYIVDWADCCKLDGKFHH